VTCSLVGTTAITTAQQNNNYQRDCNVVDGVIECESLIDDLRALSPGERGKVLYREATNRHGPIMGYGKPGYVDSQSRFVATLKSKNGDEQIREVRLKYFEDQPDSNLRLVIFDRPKDLKRRSYLTISHKQAPDEQWLYDPDNKQVQRILSNNAFTPFSGMELNFEDISPQDTDKYSYEHAGEKSHNGGTHFVVNRTPKDKYSGYSRLETWISADTYLVSKIDYYDRNEAILKTLTLEDYKLFGNEFWRATKMDMQNHQTGNSTQLNWLDYRFNTGLSKSDFTVHGLRNVN